MPDLIDLSSLEKNVLDKKKDVVRKMIETALDRLTKIDGLSKHEKPLKRLIEDLKK